MKIVYNLQKECVSIVTLVLKKIKMTFVDLVIQTAWKVLIQDAKNAKKIILLTSKENAHHYLLIVSLQTFKLVIA